jgi:hypothetical protein
MSTLRSLSALLTLTAVLLMTPGMAVLSTAGQAGAPSCCKPASPCGTGLMAADCCRTDQAPQAEAPVAAGTVITSKKQLKATGQAAADQIVGGTPTGPPGQLISEIIVRQAAVRQLSLPLFLKHAALLI